jgi:DNA-binding transcriptional ArsR family regulator
MSNKENFNHCKGFNIKTNQDTLELNLAIVQNTKKKPKSAYEDFVMMNTCTKKIDNVINFPNVITNTLSLMNHPEFSGECCKVFVALMLFCDFENKIEMSQSEIALQVGMRQQNFSRGLKKLEALNVIKKGRRIGSFHSYTVSHKYIWKGDNTTLMRLMREDNF